MNTVYAVILLAALLWTVVYFVQMPRMTRYRDDRHAVLRDLLKQQAEQDRKAEVD